MPVAKEVSVVFPAYNEAVSVRAAIERSITALRPRFERFEIIVVDDCSTDDTGKIADEMAGQYPELIVVHQPRNMGAGEAGWRGLRMARFEYVTHNAIDCPFDLADLDKMMPLMESADIVVAVRSERAGYTAYRKLTSAINLALLHVLFPLRLRDYNFTQLYRKSVLEEVKTEARSTAFVTPETLIRAYDMGYRIGEIEITYHPRLAGVATSGKPKVILHTIKDMLRFWWRRRRRLRMDGSGRRSR
jgi:glycosyltransferase involved in cell wall biosynthesis